MKEEEVEKIKDKYHHLIWLKHSLQNLKQEIMEYEKEPIVKEYLKRKKQLKSEQVYDYYQVVNLDDDHILEKAIKSVGVRNTENIFVCFGTCKHDNIIDDNELMFRKYINIELAEYEDGYIQFIPISECAEFEQSNIVLYPPKGINSDKYFSEIRKMYFTTAVNDGCDKALEKVLYKRDIQQKFQNKDNK